MTSQLLEFLQTHDEAFRSRSRLSSLYSDFRLQRSTNPDGYTANSSAWLRALSRAAKEGGLPNATGAPSDRFSLNTGEELLRELQTPEYGRPLALGSVIEEGIRKKELIPLKDFLERIESVYHKRWIEIPSLGQVVGWAVKQVLGEGRGQDMLVRGQFVVVGNVEAAAKSVIETAGKIATSNTSRVFSREMFDSTFAESLGVEGLSKNDLDVLLRHLQRDRAAIAYDAASGVVKFKAASETQPTSITEEDRSIASLRSLISSLEPQIEQLTARISQLDITARTAVSSKNTLAAKTALRQKKAATTKLEQRTATLTQLEDVYAKIEQAADQVEIVKVMEESGKTLKSLNKKTGGVEMVQDVMEGLREEMMNVDEIGQAINEISAGEIDEVEVEDELEALEKVEREKRGAVEREETERRKNVEREEKEKKEAEEAEKTRKRLAELDQVGQKEGQAKGHVEEQQQQKLKEMA